MRRSLATSVPFTDNRLSIMTQNRDKPTLTGEPPHLLLVMRAVIGGLLMGLANLVPGISGGTMLVASGIYQRFITAIAELTRLRFRPRSLLVLACVVGSAGAAIVGLAGPVKDLVVDHRWVMYSLFIGLTLGGVPVVWAMVGRATVGLWVGAIVGLLGMALLAVFQSYGPGIGAQRGGFVIMLIAGTVAAGAMILPGVSGGYLLLVLGVYVPVLAAIDQCRHALGLFRESGFAPAWQAARQPALTVVLPIGIGVVLGVVVMLQRFEKPTLGLLLGLLLGAVVGLWPFQQPECPANIRLVKGREVMTAGLDLVYIDNKTEIVKPEDYPTVFFSPTAGQVAGALGLIATGFCATALIARLGRDRPRPSTTEFNP